MEGEYYFRSLRPDEVIEKLEAKDSKPKILRDQEASTASIMEHIRYGSRPDYKSPWLSLTADLDVALAFAGTKNENCTGYSSFISFSSSNTQIYQSRISISPV